MVAVGAELPSVYAHWLYAGFILLLGAGFPLWLLVSTRYTLTDDVLKIRCGPFGWQIALQDIRNVTPTRNPLSSPALSLDRLQIDYGRGKTIMISPKDSGEFLAELWRRHQSILGRVLREQQTSF